MKLLEKMIDDLDQHTKQLRNEAKSIAEMYELMVTVHNTNKEVH